MSSELVHSFVSLSHPGPATGLWTRPRPPTLRGALRQAAELQLGPESRQVDCGWTPAGGKSEWRGHYSKHIPGLGQGLQLCGEGGA